MKLAPLMVNRAVERQEQEGQIFFTPAFVLTHMLPGTAVGVLVGDLVFTLLAFRLARRLGRDDVRFIDLDEPKMASPIIMSHRKNDTSTLLQQLIKLVREFNEWDASINQRRNRPETSQPQPVTDASCCRTNPDGAAR